MLSDLMSSAQKTETFALITRCTFRLFLHFS